MKKLFFLKVVCVVLLVCLTVGRADGQTSKPVNIVVLLDTSNRLKKEGQVQRDIRIIEYIITHFEKEFVMKHLRKGRRAGPYQHRLDIAIPEQYRAPEIPEAILEKLTIKDSGKRVGYPEFKQKRDALSQAVKDLYQFVQKENPYTGADIWKWFKKDAQFYLKEGFHNYIVCLTDGYLMFNDDIEKELGSGRFIEVGKLRDEPNWKERIIPLLSIEKDFSNHNVTFMMVEINIFEDEEKHIEHTQDYDIMIAHWDPWLKDMGITDIRFMQQLPLTKLEEIIQSFLKQYEVQE